MKQLQLGFMSSQDIADWFGLTYGSFKNRRQSRLQELREYCAFDIIRGGITITAIFYDTYEGDLSKKDVQTAVKYVKQQQKIQKREKPLLSGSMMADDLIAAQDKEYVSLTFNSAENKARRSLKKAYGTAGYDKEEKNAPIPGPYGQRFWTWATRDYDNNQYLPLTEEDWEAFSQAFYPSDKEKQRRIQARETLIMYAYEKREINAEEFASQMEKAKEFNFKQAFKCFRDITGGKTLVRCQEFELNNTFPSDDDQ